MISIDTELIKEIVGTGKRIDNRGFDEYRDIKIEPNIISSAEGSARVKLGNTEVVAGVKMEISEPYPDTPKEGTMMVTTEFVPLASPVFESGPPDENSVEAARVVDRAIRESKAIDFGKLCIREGEKAWTVCIDIDVLNDDGNIIDASGIAAITALLNTKMPDLDENEKPIYSKKGSKSLPIKEIPVSTTFVKICDKIMADPSLSEKEAMDARLTVGTVKKGDNVVLCSMQKGGSVGFTEEEIYQIIEHAEKKGDEIRAKIKKALG
ncbi:MAG: exosome complex protein Rrp42 [Candidatus Aenigmarchaeota archaeon]|nr:exosome complex protein Rrp42 [Candidatus Aenigmarchaeota archaeon]